MIERTIASIGSCMDRGQRIYGDIGLGTPIIRLPRKIQEVLGYFLSV
jgi:hypothetical protein